MKRFFTTLWPLSRKEKQDAEQFKSYVSAAQLAEIKQLLKEKKAGVFQESLKATLVNTPAYPQLNALAEKRNVYQYLTDVNALIRKKALEDSFYTFAQHAENTLSRHIGPNLAQGTAANALRKAVLLQLFSRQQLHILILGDNLSGKEWVLKNSAALAPLSAIYAGKDAAHLVAVREKSSIRRGLLPTAHNGIFCIPEFTLERKEEHSVLDAMDKGTVQYDKKIAKGEFKAHISVLATATPKGQKLLVKSLELLKKQLAFDPALLSRFHLVFVLQEPERGAYQIRTGDLQSQKLKFEDTEYMKEYISYAKKIDVDYDKRHDGCIAACISQLQTREWKFLTPVQEHAADIVRNLAKARAALNLRTEVSEEDVQEAMRIVTDSRSIHA
ncbi:MAG: hypothetical protein V1743_02240 [Nanoarchaeota archaeon]